jgi:uncharacterized protein (DUF2147 family)
MALNATFVKNEKHSAARLATSTRWWRHVLAVTASGKYWRMNYRFADKRKTLGLGCLSGGLTGKGQKAA